MSRPRSVIDLLADILLESGYAAEFVRGYTLDTFQSDPRTVRAVAHSVQTIGEAAYQLPPEVQARAPDIPWSQIVRMRHLLVHHYWKTNLPILWSTVLTDLPVLTGVVRRLCDELTAELTSPPPEAT